MIAAITYDIETISKAIQGRWLQRAETKPLKFVSLDSRKIADPATTLFFALRTVHQDAGIFLPALYKIGVRNFVVENEHLDLSGFPGANIMLVKNTLAAFQQLAVFHRKQFPALQVIGITGSNGKTVVKEWLHHLLAEEYNIVRSPKSFNSQIGVPLSVLQIRAYHTLGIFEAGISLPDEMLHMEPIIEPGIGILTNIRNAHDEGFENRRQKTREKLALFQNVNMLIYGADDKELAAEIKSFPFHPDNYRDGNHRDKTQFFTWGRDAGNQLQINSIQEQSGTSVIRAIYKSREISVSLPFTDAASVENAIHCLCVLVLLGKTGDPVLQRFQTLYPIAMRMEMIPGIHHSTLINDSYSNDLYSLSMALNFLAQQSREDNRTLILSDLVESGMESENLYQEIAALVRRQHINDFVGVGPELSGHQDLFSFLNRSEFFLSTEDFIKKFDTSGFENRVILIKGARQFGLERVSRLLAYHSHQTVLSINLTSLAYNVKAYKQKVLPDTKVMAMVKAFGYGTGAFEIASVLQYNQVDYLAVAYTDEGVSLRKGGSLLPIMVMNAGPAHFDTIVKYHLEPEIYSLPVLRSWIDFLKGRNPIAWPVHIKIDTGMHRLGFMENELEDCLTLLTVHPELKVASIFTHLSAADDPEADDFTRQQFSTFRRITARFQKVLDYPFLRHIANTAAISRFPEMELDMVRLGIGLYGIDSLPGMQQQLKTVATLTTTISQIKRVKKGESVGYGRRAILDEDKTIATVGIGYADGYSRTLGFGKGSMLVHGKLAAVAGSICMDMTMLDVTGIEDAREGDEVIVFGEDLSITELASSAETIPYEILTGISRRIKRVYFEE